MHYGYEVVNRLNGIFAFAIWNTKKEELFFSKRSFRRKTIILFF